MRARDDVDADEVALERLDSLGAGIGRRLDGRDVADDRGCDQGVADLGHRSGEFDIRSLEHGIGRLDKGNQAAGFNESNGLLGHKLIRGQRSEVRKRFTSRATTSSSLVGMTMTFTREDSEEITASLARMLALRSESSSMPS